MGFGGGHEKKNGTKGGGYQKKLSERGGGGGSPAIIG